MLAQLEGSLPAILSGEVEAPPPTRKRSVSREIQRLHALREAGALTDEQYGRMVDRLVDSDEMER